MKSEFLGYITKYAMSSGVRLTKVDILKTDSSYAREGRFSVSFLKIGRDVFEDRSEAVNDFNKRKAKRIATLKKQIDKVEKMEFRA